MKRVQKEAISNWRDHLKRKLTGQSVGIKDWLSNIKQQQGFSRDDSIPLLTAPDGSVVTSHRGKPQVLAAHFSSKMTVPDPERESPAVPVLTKAILGNITVNTNVVLQQPQQVDSKKALGPDNISPYLLKRCAAQLAVPLTTIFRGCFSSQQWPSQWKVARVCAIHKKKSRGDPQNYRPISLHSVALQSIASWDKRWQVTFAPDKTQAVLISRRQDTVNWDQHSIILEGRRIHLQESVSILGVKFDHGLTYTSHVRKVAKDAAWKLSCIRRVAYLLDAQGVGTLYKLQVTLSLPDGILAPRMVLLPPIIPP
ncbi:hypothetical protein GWK47_007011 [Chionoecetes opilio]|uniref:Reverse transcriptase n=1 Tax=Chionoecetes opilio TaxID=41210 RepID=A0A8J4YBV7_CHIOP|nr:hypothetical protein GWK47_007011 [Chionoecetes opilio]